MNVKAFNNCTLLQQWFYESKSFTTLLHSFKSYHYYCTTALRRAIYALLQYSYKSQGALLYYSIILLLWEPVYTIILVLWDPEQTTAFCKWETEVVYCPTPIRGRGKLLHYSYESQGALSHYMSARMNYYTTLISQGELLHYSYESQDALLLYFYESHRYGDLLDTIL